MPDLKNEHRDGTADLLKGAAILLMIQVHIVEQFALPAVRDSWIGKISLLFGGPPVAPVFLAVMGYFAGRSKKNSGSLVTRGLILLSLGFALNLGRTCHLLLKIHGGELQISPWGYVFGADILFAAGLSLILIGLLRPLIGSAPGAWGVAAAIVVLLTPLANDALAVQDVRRWFFAYVAGYDWWSYFPLFPWLAYPFIGVAVRLWKEQSPDDGSLWLVGRESRVGRFLSAALLVAALTVTLPQVIARCHELPKYYHHDGWLFLWICLFLVVWVRLFQAADRQIGHIRLCKWLKWMGRHVTVLYVFQWLIIGNIATAIFKTQDVTRCIGWGLMVLCGANLLAWTWIGLFGRRHVSPA